MTTEDTDITRATGSPRSAGPSRRTVVRTAANSAWAVPAVMVATSAPAFAASSKVHVTAFTAKYWAQGVAASNVRPDRLTFTASFKNDTGVSITANQLFFDVQIPRGAARFGNGDLYNSIDSVATGTPPAFVNDPAANFTAGVTPTGWTSAITTLVGGAYSHQVRFTKTTATAAAATFTLSTAVIVYWVNFSSGNEAAQEGSPFKSWVGSSYTVRGVASANVAGPDAALAVVAESANDIDTNSAMTVNVFTATRGSTSTSLVVNAIGAGTGTVAGTKTGAVTNLGRKTVGPISLFVSVPFVSGHKYYGQAPATVTPTAPTGWTAVARTGSGPWVYEFVSTGAVAYGSTGTAGNLPALGNTADFANTTITLVSGTGTGTGTTTTITAYATALFGVAPAVIDNVGT